MTIIYFLSRLNMNFTLGKYIHFNFYSRSRPLIEKFLLKKIMIWLLGKKNLKNTSHLLIQKWYIEQREERKK